MKTVEEETPKILVAERTENTSESSRTGVWDLPRQGESLGTDWWRTAACMHLSAVRSSYTGGWVAAPRAHLALGVPQNFSQWHLHLKLLAEGLWYLVWTLHYGVLCIMEYCALWSTVYSHCRESHGRP